MPLGQFTGAKAKYQYESDSGDIYIISRDVTLATDASIGLVAFDPATAPAGAQPAPKGFKPRGVWWQSNPDATPPNARKFLICGTPLATLYESSQSQTLEIDQVAGRTTGRVGEKLSF